MNTAASSTPVHPTSNSPIEKLPAELLLTIFKFAYVAARRSWLTPTKSACDNTICLAEGKCFCYHLPGEAYGWDTSKGPLTTLFPNSLASVCSHWGKIMLLVPVFWTRVVVLLDSSIFPPPDLSHQLSAAGDRTIDVIVTRASKLDIAGPTDVEESRMAHIVNVLRPHLQRCRKLHFDVAYSSSLPRIAGILLPVMPHLRVLSLDSCSDTGPPTVLPYIQPDETSMINWQNLKTVSIDGWNFTDLYNRVPDPVEQIFSNCKSLAVKFGGERFPFGEISQLLNSTSISRFTADSVSFTQEEDLDDALAIDTLVLKNLDAELTNMILSFFIDISHLAIINCSGQDIDQMPAAHDFILDNIGIDQHIGNFISTWEGVKLHVTKCPGFDDDMLRMMTNLDADNPSFYTYGDMKRLYISRCNNFSITALKQLVRSRNNSAQWDERQLLTIRVNAGFPLSKADESWFSKRVQKFSWQKNTRE